MVVVIGFYRVILGEVGEALSLMVVEKVDINTSMQLQRGHKMRH